MIETIFYSIVGWIIGAMLVRTIFGTSTKKEPKTEKEQKQVDWKFNQFLLRIDELKMGDANTYITYDANGSFVLQHKHLSTLLEELTEKFEYEAAMLTSEIFEQVYIIEQGELFEFHDNKLIPVEFVD